MASILTASWQSTRIASIILEYCTLSVRISIAFRLVTPVTYSLVTVLVRCAPFAATVLTENVSVNFDGTLSDDNGTPGYH